MTARRRGVGDSRRLLTRQMRLKVPGEVVDHDLRRRLDHAAATGILRDRADELQLGVDEHARSRAVGHDLELDIGARGAAGALLVAVGPGLYPQGLGVDLLVGRGALERERDGTEPHRHGADIGAVALGLDELCARKARRDPFDVVQYVERLPRGERNDELVVQLHRQTSPR